MESGANGGSICAAGSGSGSHIRLAGPTQLKVLLWLADPAGEALCQRPVRRYWLFTGGLCRRGTVLAGDRDSDGGGRNGANRNQGGAGQIQGKREKSRNDVSC